MQGKKQYDEKLFISFQLSQHVPRENLYRQLKEVLDLSFLRKHTVKYYGTEGQKSIDPEVFFKLMLVGFLENLNSDRRIMATTAMRLDIMYFIGYNIDEPLPWHSTLSRTRQLYGRELFQLLFSKVLALCVQKGMVLGRQQAIDSVYIKANASLDRLVEKQVISETEVYARELDQNMPPEYTVTQAKKKQVEGHHAWKKKAYKDMPGSRVEDEEGNAVRPKYLSNHTHYSPTDPDARISTKPGKPRQLNYSGQVSVDTHSHLICGAVADYADRRDSQSLPRILATTIDNLKPHGIKIEELLADTGYSSGDALRAIDFHRIDAYIPNFGGYKPQREGFNYDAQNDRYICSQGAILPFKTIRIDPNGNRQKHYRSSSKDCKKCLIRTSCLGKSLEKIIRSTTDKDYYDRMHEKMQTPKARALKKVRQSTVEPVLGTLTNFLAMRKVNTRGIEQAQKHVLMACIAYNLKKYINYLSKQRHTAVAKMNKTLAKGLNRACFSIFKTLIRLLMKTETVLTFY